MSFFKKDTPNANCVAKNTYKPKQAGNVFAMLFGAVAMVGVVGASTMTVMRGPVKSMSEVTKRTIAENNMMVTAKLAVISVANLPTGDCDSDGTTEAPGYSGSTIATTNGGQIPSSVGVSKQDPWGQEFVYCAWDHGSDNDQTCGAATGYLEGDTAASPSEYAVAIISAGPDGNYQTTCNDYTGPDSLITRTSGADDIIFGYTFQEASIVAGGLWTEGGSGEAEIQRDLVVTDGTNEQFNFSLGSQTLQIGNDSLTGTGKFAVTNTALLTGYTGIADNLNISLASGSISHDGNPGDGLSMNAANNLTNTGSISANALISSTTLGVTGAATVGSLNAGSGAITTTGALSTGNASVGTLGTSGAITTGGNIILGSNFLSGDGGNEGISVDASGNATASNDLTVSGTFTPNTLDVTNNATVGGTLEVTGPTTLAALSAGATSITGNLDLNSNKLVSLGTPTLDGDAATKKYVDDNIAAGTGFSETDPQVGDVSTAGRYCISDGDSVECTVATPPGDNLGDHTATTDLNMASEQINNLAPPTLGGDAANKTYVDNAVSSAAGSDDKIMDADGNTQVQVEEGANDDTIRFDTAGVERMSIDSSGQLRMTNDYVEDDQSRDYILISTSQTPLTAATLTASRTFDGLELVLDAVGNEDTGNDIFYNARGTVSRAIWDSADTGTDGGALTGVFGIGQQSGSGILRNSTGVRGLTSLNSLGTITSATGTSGQVRAFADGNITVANGVRAVVNTAGTGTISTALGVNSSIEETGGGTITSGEAYRADCDDADTCYGLRIIAGDAEVLPDRDWGIHVDGEDKNYFSGKVGIGDNIPNGTLLLDVEGQIGATEYCDENGANCVTAAALAAATGGTPDELADADGDTKIQVEQSADDDIIRFEVAGSEAMTIRTAADWITSPLTDTSGFVVHEPNTFGANISSISIRNSSSASGGNYLLFGSGSNKGVDYGSIGTDGTDTHALALASDGSRDIKFSTNATEKMRIKAAGNIGIGTDNPNASSLLELSSSDKGFLPPRVSDPSADITSPATGLIAYDSTDDELQVFDGTSWVPFSGSNGGDNFGNHIATQDIQLGFGDYISHTGVNEGLTFDNFNNTRLQRVSSAVTDILSLDNRSEDALSGLRIAMQSAGNDFSKIESIRVDADNALLNFYSRSGAALNKRMVIHHNGGIGIGDDVPDGTLLLDIEGQVGATEYCDENGANCVTAAALAAATGGNVDELSDADGDTKIQVEEGADDDTIRFDVAGVESLTVYDQTGWSSNPLNDTTGVVIHEPGTHGGNVSSISIRGNSFSNGATKLIFGHGGNKNVNYGEIGTDGSDALSSHAMNINAYDNRDIKFRAGAGEIMRIDAGSNNIVIGSSGVPDISALLDIQSTSKGFLPPRVSDPTSDIASPATGLIAYDSTDDELQVFDGTSWVSMNGSGATALQLIDTDGDTKIQVEEGADDDTIRFDVAGVESLTLYDQTGWSSNPLNNTTGVVIHEPGTHGGNTTTMSIRNSSSSAGGNFLRFGRGANKNVDYAQIGTNGNDALSANALMLETFTSRDIKFRTNGSDRMRIKGSGNIVVGSSGLPDASALFDLQSTNQGLLPPRVSDPTSDIASPATGLIAYDSTDDELQVFDGTSWVSMNSSDTTALQLIDTDGNTKIQVEEGANDDTIRFDTAGTERMVIDETGNVGIGTDAPNAPLEVSFASDNPVAIFRGGNVGRIRVARSSSDNVSLGMSSANIAFLNGSSNQMSFITNGFERARFNNERLGIGTTSPSTSALLELSTTDKGFLPPRVSDPTSNIASPATGLIAYDSTDDELQVFDGTSWVNLADTGGGSSLFTDNTTHITRENFHILDAGLAAGSTTAGLDGDGIYSFYDPDRGILRGGRITGGNDAWEDNNIGDNSFAWGIDTQASGNNSISLGQNSTASGLNSFASGLNVTSSAQSSTAFGLGTTASADGSTAFGLSTTASGASSTAFGLGTTASGFASLVLGRFTNASGVSSIALGNKTSAGDGTAQTVDGTAGKGNYSIAFGLGDSSTAIFPQVTGNESIAMFFGDQNGEDITATNVLALEGGSLLLSNDSGTACAANKKGALRLNAGEDGIEMCDGVSTWAAFTGTGDDLGNHTATTDLIMGGNKITLTNDVALGPDILLNGGGLIAAQGTLQFTIDSNNDSANDSFIIRKDADNNTGAEIFSVAETGLVSFAGVTGAAAPTK